MDRVNEDVLGELERSRVGPSFATAIMGDAQDDFPLLRVAERGKKGNSVGP
jgi:hypothetical protein